MSDEEARYEELTTYRDQVRKELLRREHAMLAVVNEINELQAKHDTEKMQRLVMRGNVLGILSRSSYNESIKKTVTEKEKERTRLKAEVERARARLLEVEKELEGFNSGR